MNQQQKNYLNLIKTEPYLFGKVLGFDDLTELHNDWIKSFLFEENDQTLLAHRGSYKTTCLVIAISLMLIIYPNKAIDFFRKTDTDVTEIVLQIKKALISDDFQKLAYVLYGTELKLIKATGSEISTNIKTSNRGVSQFLGMGIKTSITGKHGDIVITDDIVNITDRVSRAERERIKQQYQELQNIKNRGGRIINTGTPWHKDDAITHMPNVRRFSINDTNLITPEQAQHLRDSMTPSLFSANYELKHIADTDAMFSAPAFTNDISLIYGGLGHADAAYGGNDSTAYTIIKEQPDGSLVGYGKLWHKHVDDALGELEALHEHYRAGTIAVETNGDKGYLAKRMRSDGMITDEYHENQNKFIKVSTYLRKYWKQIRWLEDTDPDYLLQVLDYTEHAEHDDAPDSAASLIRYIKGTEQWLV